MPEMESWDNSASELYTYFFSETQNSSQESSSKSISCIFTVSRCCTVCSLTVTQYFGTHHQGRPVRCNLSTLGSSPDSSFWTLKNCWYTAPIRKSPSFPFLAFKETPHIVSWKNPSFCGSLLRILVGIVRSEGASETKMMVLSDDCAVSLNFWSIQ